MPYNFLAESFHTEKLCGRISSRKDNFLWKRPFWVFREPLEGLGATHTVHLGLIGKPILDCLLVIVELFC